jgi:glycosyltransferase involved in cell wall biosynthesis
MAIRIVIDALGSRAGGGAAILDGLLAELAVHREWAISVLSEQPAVGSSDSHPRSFWRVLRRRIVCSKLFRPIWAELIVPLATRRARADVLLALTGTSRGGHVPHVTYLQQALVFDSSPYRRHPKRRMSLYLLRRQVKRSTARASVVIVQTDTMAKTLSRQGWQAKIVEVCRPQVPPIFAPAPDSAEPKEYWSTPKDRRLLYVGSLALHKNFSCLLKGLDILRCQYPATRLFVIGSELSEHPGTGDDAVVFLGQHPRAELPAFYQHATLLAFPSLVETVGLPLLEAMKTSTAVVVADRPYAREVCGLAAQYFNPFSPQEFAAIVGSLFTNEAQRNSMGALGLQQAERWSRRAEYSTVASVLNKVAKGLRPA